MTDTSIAPDSPGAQPGTASPRLEFEEVIVTGTRITRRDFASPSPVYTLDGDAIRMQGLPTVEEVLNRLPQFSPSFGRNGGFSVVELGVQEASINLRGLGANRNLVLLDGGRLGTSGSEGVVNVNTLPSVMIERVEVLTGGASSVYGSDAMSGVVNFITRQDFEGVELTGNYEISDESDADVWSINAAGGFNFADDRGNVSGFIDYYDREPLFGDERDFSRVPLQDDAQAAEWGWIDGDPVGEFIAGGNYYTPSGVVFPGADIAIFDEDGNPRPMQLPEDTFNRHPYMIWQSDLERISGRLQVKYQFNDNLAGHADLLASHHEDSLPAPPTADWAVLQVNTDNPVLTPATRQLFEDNFEYFGDGIAHIFMLRRYSELGERARTHDWESDSWRLKLGLEGNTSSDWRWEADYFYSEQDYDYTFKGGVSRSRLQQGVLVDPASGQCYDTSNGCVPADVFGPGHLSAEAVDFLSAPPAEAESTMTMQQVMLFTEGEIDMGWLPALSLGAGLELRSEDGDYDPDPALMDIDLIGFEAFDVVDGDYDMAEVFVEVFLPLLRDRNFARELSLEAGLRYSDHSEIDDFWTWKSGISWAPVESLRLRAMFQRAVRAPNLEEMFLAADELTQLAGPTLEEVQDPCSAINDPVGNGYTELCVAQGIPEDQVGTWEANPIYPRTYRWSGNTDIDTEEADTWTVGFVWQPNAVEGLSLAVDWYQIEIDDAIEFMPSELAISACFESGIDSSEYCQAFDRAEDGNIEAQLSTFRNLSMLTAEGVDLQLEYAVAAPGDLPGRLRLGILGNWNRESSGQFDNLSTEYHCEGLFGSPCDYTSMGAYPEFRTTTTFGYDIGRLTTELRWYWLDEMDNAWNEYPPDWLQPDWPLAADSIDSMSYYDLNASWQATDNLNVTAGVINLTDEKPPILGSQARWMNTEPAMYDTLGRRYHLSIRWRL